MKNSIDIFKSPLECCGCQNCFNICPKKAITLTENSEGFIYPKVDQQSCINCGLCLQVCSFNSPLEEKSDFNSKFYLAKNKDKEIRRASRSGGAFTEISDYILELGGVVYGAQFNSNLEVVHGRAENQQQRDNFRGSKYVQSNLEKIFSQVMDDLEKRLVLFSGTPCQVDSLYKYLKVKNKNYLLTNLYTCDIICHGVMSPKFWKENLKLLSNGRLLSHPNFRDKSYGWNSHIESYYIDNKKITSSLYTLVFHSDCFLRESCYNCPYTNLNRVSDITLGDAWGVEKVDAGFDDNDGVSLIMINSPKGNDMFSNKMSSFDFILVEDMHPLMQPMLIHPVKKPKNILKLKKLYKRYGFQGISKYLFIKRGIKVNLSKIKKLFLRH